MVQMLAYFQLFSLMEETELRTTRKNPPCTAQVLKTLPTYAQAEWSRRGEGPERYHSANHAPNRG